MDAVEFLKEHKRMCGQNACESCPLHSNSGCDLLIGVPESLDLRECVEAVEQWAKAHPAKPVKTRQSEFLKMFPNAYIAPGNDTICISPCNLDLSLQDRDECKEYNCAECRKNYWLQEVE